MCDTRAFLVTVIVVGIDVDSIRVSEVEFRSTTYVDICIYTVSLGDWVVLDITSGINWVVIAE